MTTTINASNSGSGGLVQTADASGVLALQTAGTTAVTIDTSQNVGIGTASPNKKLEVVSAGEIIRATSNTGANDQVISIKSNSGTADCSTNIFFADRYAATSYASSYIRGTSSGTSALIFATGGTNFTNIYDAGAPTEQARITAAGLLQFNSGYGSVATAYGCRAWVNFNGTGTVAIRASGNVSSITDNGTGNYSVNFATAMPDANYAPVMSIEESGITCFAAFNNTVQQTAGVGRIGVFLGTGSSPYDAEQVNYVVLR
jgi:hypothetical protein